MTLPGQSYCRRCDGYSAEVGKPNADGLCPACSVILRLADWIETHVEGASVDRLTGLVVT